MIRKLGRHAGARNLAAALALLAVGGAWAQHAARTHERLKMIRGNVAQDGTILGGAGFSVASVDRVAEYNGHAVEIVYEIAFDRPFHSAPSITVTPLGPILADNPDETQANALVQLSGPDRAMIWIGRPELPSPDAPRGFGFVVVGP